MLHPWGVRREAVYFGICVGSSLWPQKSQKSGSLK
jgi:hypothetical protein